MPDKKVTKRKNQYTTLNADASQKLVEEIDRLNESKKMNKRFSKDYDSGTMATAWYNN